MKQNFKRFIYSIALIASLFISLIYAQPDAIQKIPSKIWIINKETVELYKKRIIKKLIRNKYERIVGLCATTAVVAAVGWYVFKSPEVAISQNTEDTNKIVVNIKTRAEENQQIMLRIDARLERMERASGIKFAQPTAKTPPSLMKKWGEWVWGTCRTVGQGAVQQTGMLLLMGFLPLPRPIEKLLNFWGKKVENWFDCFYHDTDFHWFLTSQTKTVSYFNDLERAAELLPLVSDSEEREHQKASMIWAADVLVKQLAQVIAFMEYQASRLKFLNTGCSIQMNASAKYMYRHVGQFSQKLQTMLEDPTKHAEIPAYIKNVRESMRSEQTSFCVNEQAALYDISDLVA